MISIQDLVRLPKACVSSLRITTTSGALYRACSADAVTRFRQPTREIGILSYWSRNNFDAVVTDIALPDRSGYELIALANQRYSIKGIAFSNFRMQGDLRRSFCSRVRSLFDQPVDFQNLRTVLNEIVVKASWII